jgi:GT2 family glycosyltransferase
MELSVIIVSFNVSDFLKQCLLSVRRASENIDCEIFVVDNNSMDDSCNMVTREFPEVVLINNKTNWGYSVANNQAIKLSKGRYVLLLNPDTIVEHDTLERCISFMDINEKAGALGVRMVNGEGQFLPESKRALPDPKTEFFKAFGFSFLFPDSKLYNRYYFTHVDTYLTAPVEVISGAFMFLRKEALNKTGLLDEDFFMYGEDIDMSYRLLQSGFSNYYFADTQIIHFKGKSSQPYKYTDIIHFYNAMRIYIMKRNSERIFRRWRFMIIPLIYFRQSLAILNRFFRIRFRNL